MARGLRAHLLNRIVRWLNRERPLLDVPPLDFERLCYEIRPCDVLLVEGRSRVSDIIKSITLSNWTHVALYVGRLHDIDAPEIRERVRAHSQVDADEQLILEAVLGHGTIVSPLSRYREDHIRICRPRELRRRDAQTVINYCISRLGREYDVRHLLDLARFLVPYSILPRRWRSSLFMHGATAPARTICSSLLAGAFAAVRYPVLPVLRRDQQDRIHLQKRNFRLLTPGDFDHSPYFDVIKYPLMAFDDLSAYRRMPWDPDSVFANGPDQQVVLAKPSAAGESEPSAPAPAPASLPMDDEAQADQAAIDDHDSPSTVGDADEPTRGISGSDAANAVAGPSGKRA